MRFLLLLTLLTIGCRRSQPTLVEEKKERQEAKLPANPKGQPQPKAKQDNGQAWVPVGKGADPKEREVAPIAKQPAQPAPVQGNPNPLEVVQGVRGAVNRTVTQNELKNLHLYIDTASGASGEMPTPQQILTDLSGPMGDKKLAAAIQDGSIVLTGIRTREGIWAYEKIALTAGGWVVKNDGVDRMTAQQLQQALQN